MDNTGNLTLEQLKSENEKLRKELEHLKLFYGELESTNQHLISATWRERDMKKQLKDTIDELNKTKELLDSQNKRISESINYARRIQLAINATETDLCNEYTDSFILYKPKDVISGDFPWFYKSNQYIYVAAVDCTGHGVPGAMLSLIGNLLLNDIINNYKTHTPAQILAELHRAVVRTLKQEQADSNSNDGMDIALCRIDTYSNELIFSGAHRPLLLYKDGVQGQVPGDKFPIGGIQYKGKNTYTDYTFKVNKGDSLLIFSDGYPDQIGGPENRKLMTKYIKEVYERCNTKHMQEIKKYYNEVFESWKGESKQIDDVIMIGIRF